LIDGGLDIEAIDSIGLNSIGFNIIIIHFILIPTGILSLSDILAYVYINFSLTWGWIWIDLILSECADYKSSK